MRDVDLEIWDGNLGTSGRIHGLGVAFLEPGFLDEGMGGLRIEGTSYDTWVL